MKFSYANKRLLGFLLIVLGLCWLQIVHVEEINARVADFTEIPDELSENAKSSLKAMGITKLYSHQVRICSFVVFAQSCKSWYQVSPYLLQAESIRASLCGRNVVVATMTSSGKSLCYNLPVLEALSQNDLACALYLFPTKVIMSLYIST